MRIPARFSVLTAMTTAFAAAIALSLAGASAAYAAGGYGDLPIDPATCTDGDILTLTQDISGGELMIGCDLTLDLAGFTLTAGGVVIAMGKTFTVDDSGTGGRLESTGERGMAGILTYRATFIVEDGTIVAVGGSFAAGIGGTALSADAESLIVRGGDVTATAGGDAAAIGGGYAGAVGTVMIDGGTVTATGSTYGAGIGSGPSHRGVGGTITIDGGTVTATGGEYSAGIGGGYLARGSSVTIGDEADVTASGANAVGGGPGVGGLYFTAFGSLQLAGALHVPSGRLDIPQPDSNSDIVQFEITPTGRLLGTAADPTIGATVTGRGEIENHGVIALDASLVGVSVLDHDYAVSFDTGTAPPLDAVQVFAETFDEGYRVLPQAPAGTQWNTSPDGRGTAFTASTTLTGDLTLYAVDPAAGVTLTLTPSATTVDQGGTLTFTVTGMDATGNPVDTSGAVLTSSVATDEIDGLTVTFPHASPHTITATLGSVTASVTVEVSAAASGPSDGGPAATDSELADSGGEFDLTLWLLLVGLFLTVGGGLIAARRRLV